MSAAVSNALVAFGLGCVIGACASGSTKTQHACRPLDPVDPAPTTLTTIVGAGRDRAGTIYAVESVDAAKRNLRLFISVGQSLMRVDEAGAGGDATFYVFSVERDGKTQTVALDTAQASPRLALADGQFKGGFEEVAAAGEVLEPVHEAEVRMYRAFDLAATLQVEYAAQTADDRQLVVLRPVHWSGDYEFRVFLGANAALAECVVSHAIRAHNGETTIDFVSNGAALTAVFPASPLFCPACSQGAVLRDERGKETALSLESAGVASGYGYTCL